MSLERVNEHPEWILVKRFNRKELEALKEIFPFYVVNTLYDQYSYRGIPVSEYGWSDNVWNTGELKEQLFHVANLSLGHNLIMVERLDEMSEVCQRQHLGEDFYQYRDQERIVVYVNSRANLVMSIFKHIRNALAHGRFVLYPSGEDYIFVLESVDHALGDLVVKARMVLRASTLINWMNIITKGPQDVVKRKRKKK